MAALTADRSTIEREFPDSMIHELTATAAVQFYKGGMVAIDDTTGLLIKAAIDTAADKVVGICLENKLTVSGDRIRFKSGCFKVDNAGDIDVTFRGQLCYIADDQTVTEASGDDPVAGTVYDVDSDGVWVYIKYPNPATVAVEG